MKFELERLPRGASIEEIKNEIIRVSNLIPDTIILKKKFDAISKISTSSLLKKFGSWEKTLNECGLGHRYSGKSVTSKMRNQVSRNLSDDELISELQRIANLLDKNFLTKEDIDSNSSIGTSVLRSRFGSLKCAIELAGFKISDHAKRYTDKECFENLLEMWTFLGRQPKYLDMDMKKSNVGKKAYIVRWGNWTSALKAFIEFIDNENPKEKEIAKENDNIKKISRKPKKKNKRDISLGLRYKILNRDRFRCVKCGNSPSSDLTCELHIDHIIPFSKGGLTNLENLQTTCKNCNLGKGNRYNE